MNGNKGGKEGGNWTFNRGETNSVIDYVVTNVESWGKVEKFEVGLRLESDHQPITTVIRRKEGDLRRIEEAERIQHRWTQCWGEKKRKIFEEREEKLNWLEKMGEEKWIELKKGVKECMVIKKREPKEKGK
ncbi:Protein of unknown function [Cotesia congregata]|uniref:Endonuclease/exonuclease/phosphatase domain-containing protein n=1 Tax=Cotesia congregata TaxID=51543 RepID=A0A8J2H823_COTCN|nr:Protein of unknown function [Cotesia congregata]